MLRLIKKSVRNRPAAQEQFVHTHRFPLAGAALGLLAVADVASAVVTLLNA